VIGQSGAFAAALVGWYRRPHRAWGITLGIGFALVLAVSVLGVLFGG